LPAQTSYAARNCLNRRDALKSLPDSEVWVVERCYDHEHRSRSNQLASYHTPDDMPLSSRERDDESVENCR